MSLYHEPRRACASLATATLKQCPEDFRVDEIAGFEPTGEGEHVYLHIEKSQTNTEWLARQLADLAGIHPRDVGYSGLKDRQAVTTQWFSVLVPADREPDWTVLNSDLISVQTVTRSSKKLKTGAHRGNRFRIRLRDVAVEDADLQARIALIREQGVPNYFASQRFGHDGGNLEEADAMLTGRHRIKSRHKRGLYLSAARSHIFNRVLEHRVQDGSWNHALPGDCMMLDGSNSFFHVEIVDEEILRRLAEQDIHPSGPLPAGGTPPVSGEPAAIEQAVYAEFEHWAEGFRRAGLREQRRALRLGVRDLEAVLDDSEVVLSFSLPSGAYATTVVAELFTVA